ncbi:hypothetical protein GGI05_002661, partial [Coemansia sp. RSA 2603]
MLSSARSLSKQVLSHRQQIQQQTKTQLRTQHSTHHTTPSRPKEQQQQQQPQQQIYEDDLHKSAMLEKMRLENRERKKRWREVNGERNKDNDLRCRVNKRANQLYGLQASEAKERWIGEEFERRQQRRREKEGRKRMQSPGVEEHTEGVLEDAPVSASTIAQDAVSAAAPEDRAAKCARRDGRQDAASSASASAGRIPLGFGSYAAMPSHQVRAAYDFWKSAAEHHALETSFMASSNESQFARAHGNIINANEVTGHPHRQLRLPPLSSIVPENYLSHNRIYDTHNAATQASLANAHASAAPAADAAELQQLQSSNPSAHVPPSLLADSEMDAASAPLNYRSGSSYHSDHAPPLSASSPSLLHMSVDSIVPNPHIHSPPLPLPPSSSLPLAGHHSHRRHLRPWEDDSASI